MTHFLIRYNRRTEGGEIVRRFSEDETALAATELRRLETEKLPHEEVVMLTSNSEASIRKTHARYFVRAEDLLRL